MNYRGMQHDILELFAEAAERGRSALPRLAKMTGFHVKGKWLADRRANAYLRDVVPHPVRRAKCDACGSEIEYREGLVGPMHFPSGLRSCIRAFPMLRVS